MDQPILVEIASLSCFLALTSTVVIAGKRLARRPVEPPQPSSRFARRPAFGSWTAPLAGALPATAKQRQNVAKDFVAAGNLRRTAADDFFARRNLAVLLVSILVFAGFASGVFDGREIVVASIGGTLGLLVFCVPKLQLASRAAGRRRAIEKALPDAMDMIAMAIRGGQPLPQAVSTVSSRLDTIYPDLAHELRIACSQAESGSIEFAFDALSKRIDLPEMAGWCAMMRQSQQLGGQLAGSLSEYAARIRDDRQRRAERSGNTASLKLLLPVVLCLAPPIGVLLVGPAVIEFRDFIHRNKDKTQNAIEQVRQDRD